jgi:hypothetical protein
MIIRFFKNVNYIWPNTYMQRGVRCRLVKVVDFKSLAPSPLWFQFRKATLDSFKEAIQLAYGTSVVLLRCPFGPEIMHGRAPELFLHRLSWNVAVWRKPHSNKQTSIYAKVILYLIKVPAEKNRLSHTAIPGIIILCFCNASKILNVYTLICNKVRIKFVWI